MSQLHVKGGYPLRGTIKIYGAKNAALPLMAASLLTREPIHLTNVPHISDVTDMAEILASHGVSVERGDHSLILRSHKAVPFSSSHDRASRIRGSVLLLGPLVARFDHVKVPLPGGCKIDANGRPINMHLAALEQLGAVVNRFTGEVQVGGRLQGHRIRFDKVSVGATENALMAASLATGLTVLDNAAMEPEVSDLAHLLRSMGAQIEGKGTQTLRITGVRRLGGARHTVIPDRIAASTYAIAALMTKGDLELDMESADDGALMGDVLQKLREAGAQVAGTRKGFRIKGTRRPTPVSIITQPYPGFPTDLQPQWTALMSLADGFSTIEETIFDQRFQHVEHLRRMGAQIRYERAGSLKVTGVDASQLRSATVTATDLRAAAALLLFALVNPGSTVITDIQHLERGYEDVVRVLGNCGAQIVRRFAQTHA